MAIKDKNTLKAYFENGDIPTQEQFEDLIDSLKHQDDASASLSKPYVVLMNNRIISENGYITYYTPNMGNARVLLEVDQQNAPSQVIEIGNTGNNQVKRYFIGDAPYTVSLKEFQGENLGTNEYYSFDWQVSSDYGMGKLFGNNLPNMAQGFEFGVLQKERFIFQVSKQDLGQQVNLVHTTIQLDNSTGTTISYRTQSSYWGDKYRIEDSTTDHYDIWDTLYFYFNADMTNASQPIVCRLYDKDNGQLVQTTNLEPGQNYQNTWGGQVNGIRNVLIECTK